MEELLKSFNLTEEEQCKILAKYNSELELTKSELEKQLELSKEEISTRDKQLKELSKVDVNELQDKLKAFEADNKALVEKHNAEIAQLKTDYAIEKALTKARARNLVATKSLLDLTVLQLDEKGNLTGLDEQIKKLTEDESTSFMFASQEQTQKEFKGFNPVETPNTPIGVDTKNMTYQQLCELYPQD